MTKAQKQVAENLLRVGTMMSNTCYNLGQHARFEPPRRTIDKHDLQSMATLAREWDAAVSHFRSVFEPHGGKRS